MPNGHFIVFWILARLCALFRPYFGSCCVCLSSRLGFSFFFVCFIFFLDWVFLCVVGFLCFVLVFRILIDSILFSGLGYFVCFVFLIFPLIGFLMLVLVFLVACRFSFGVFGFLCYFA